MISVRFMHLDKGRHMPSSVQLYVSMQMQLASDSKLCVYLDKKARAPTHTGYMN